MKIKKITPLALILAIILIIATPLAVVAIAAIFWKVVIAVCS